MSPWCCTGLIDFPRRSMYGFTKSAYDKSHHWQNISPVRVTQVRIQCGTWASHFLYQMNRVSLRHTMTSCQILFSGDERNEFGKWNNVILYGIVLVPHDYTVWGNINPVNWPRVKWLNKLAGQSMKGTGKLRDSVHLIQILWGCRGLCPLQWLILCILYFVRAKIVGGGGARGIISTCVLTGERNQPKSVMRRYSRKLPIIVKPTISTKRSDRC